MRLSSYMRGIGIGIAVTALILHFTDGRASAMSDGQPKNDTTVSSNAPENVHERLATPTLSANNVLTLPNVGESGIPDILSESLKQQNGAADSTPTAAEPSAEDPAPTTPLVISPTPEGGQAATETPTPAPTATTAPTATPTPEPTPTPKPTATPTPTPTVTPTPTATPTPVPLSEDTEGGRKSLNTGDVEITVVSGDGSYTVAKRLAEAGIVSSAAEFDEFLCKNGYDRKIAVGKHVIPAQCSYERIAQILTGK